MDVPVIAVATISVTQEEPLYDNIDGSDDELDTLLVSTVYTTVHTTVMVYKTVHTTVSRVCMRMV